MSTATVYRIQHPEDHSGPYFGKHSVGSALDYSYSRHPEPHEDGIQGSIAEELVCGFADRESMANWFHTADAQFLHSMGFAVAVYEVPERELKIGGHQLMFPQRGEPKVLIPIPECGAWDAELVSA